MSDVIIPTVALVRTFPHYWIAGEGSDLASRTKCPHDYFLTDSCPGCDAQDTPDGLDLPINQALADTIARDDIRYWALDHLGADDAARFADDLDADLNDWVENVGATIGEVFGAALQHWRERYPANGAQLDDDELLVTDAGIDYTLIRTADGGWIAYIADRAAGHGATTDAALVEAAGVRCVACYRRAAAVGGGEFACRIHAPNA